MGRLFLRIFLWFWFASTCLLIVLFVGMLIRWPDSWAPWPILGRGAMRAFGMLAASTYEREGEAGVASLLGVRKTRLRIWMFTADGTSVAGDAPPLEAHDLVEEALSGGEADGRSAYGLVLLARRVTSDSGKPYVFLWESPPRFSGDRANGGFLLWLGVLILTGGLVCWGLTRQITKPIRTLRGAAQRFSQGDLSVRIGEKRELRRGDELSELASDFDDMASRIEELLKSQQQLLADISHELRSPLARVSLALNLAERRLGGDVPEHQRIEREVQRLNDLIEQLLTLARLQGQPNQGHGEMIDVRSLVHEIAEDARFEAEAKNRDVVLGVDCHVSVKGSRSLLRSAIENVVRNAVRHTPENGEVRIDMEAPNGTGRLAITVRDHGCGVPVEALERVFDPFFRVEEGRDRTSGGVGLGLAIARQAMRFHGGSATAHNHPDGGLVVRLELPLNEGDSG